MLKLCVRLFLSCIFYHTNQKNVLQKEKDWTFEVFLLPGEPSPLIMADWIIENDVCQILFVFPDFFSNAKGLHCFSQPDVLSKLSITTVTCPESV